MVPAPPVGQPPLPPPMAAPTAGSVVVKSYDPKEAAAQRYDFARLQILICFSH